MKVMARVSQQGGAPFSNLRPTVGLEEASGALSPPSLPGLRAADAFREP